MMKDASLEDPREDKRVQTLFLFQSLMPSRSLAWRQTREKRSVIFWLPEASRWPVRSSATYLRKLPHRHHTSRLHGRFHKEVEPLPLQSEEEATSWWAQEDD